MPRVRKKAGTGRALATHAHAREAGCVSVLTLPPRGEWLADARDGRRALRVSWHGEQGCVVLSLWRDDACVGTVRLGPAEAAALVGTLADGLAAGVLAAEHGGAESA